jgi:hypothetical protein
LRFIADSVLFFLSLFFLFVDDVGCWPSMDAEDIVPIASQSGSYLKQQSIFCNQQREPLQHLVQC